MDNLTSILGEMEKSPLSPEISDRLLGLVYDELRRMASRKLRSEAPGQTLQATALVHEVWLRLLDSLSNQANAGETWENRRHFFGAAAEAMRRILIEKARFKKRLKRGGPNAKRRELNASSQLTNPIEDDVLDLHSALAEFEKVDAVKAQIVKLKFFIGLTTNEIAETTQLSAATVERYWVYARAWLHKKMAEKGTYD
ncbi:MAG: ECF-type sigma factor [Pirellula sp.]|jgi:RNA polymerase sigma factor (TIGR02999 family)|nr:ECF-type sigma factor [Pirellula sp.]